MRLTLKVLSALLSYPTAELQAAVPELRAALDHEALLPARQRDRLDRVLEEVATADIYDLQERYVLLFDRTRSLSLHLFEHVHGESRDRGQAMVDLADHYAQHGMEVGSNELPDFLPLFLEFLSVVPADEAKGLIDETAQILETLRQRLKKRKSSYSSVLSSVQSLARTEMRAPQIAAAVAAEPNEDPNDLDALDAQWLDEEVKFGPSAADACGHDALAAKIRAGRRPVADAPASPRRPRLTVNGIAQP